MDEIVDEEEKKADDASSKIEKEQAERSAGEQEEEDWESEEDGNDNKRKPNKTILYELLNIERTATPSEIKKAYYVLALKLHPDKNVGDDEARAKFQKIKEAYEILSKPEKRKRYDETGTYGDDFETEQF